MAREIKTREQLNYIAHKLRSANPLLGDKAIALAVMMYKEKEHDNYLWGKYGVQCDYEKNQCFDDEAEDFIEFGDIDEKLQ